MLSLLEAKSRTRGGRHDVAGVRDQAGESDYRPAPPGSSWSVPGAAVAKSVHRERRWTETSVGGRGTGGQDRPTGRGHHPQSDLRGRLSRLLVWISSGAQPAPSAGCALVCALEQEGELRS